MEKEKLLKNLAQIVSYIFHPLLMTSFACLIVFNSGHYLSVVNADIRNSIYSIFFILTFLLPALFIPILYYFQLISKLEIDERKERLLPLFTISIMYALAFYFMKRISMPPILINIILASIVSLVCCFIITIFWKISLHTCGLGGLFGLLLYLANNLHLSVLLIGLILILISGLVAAARLYLRRHSPAQVYAGYILGFTIIYVSLIIL
jgi:membrane-associated phospholipid phosphatase